MSLQPPQATSTNAQQQALTAQTPAGKALELHLEKINKLRNRAQIISALKHLCRIARNILNNPDESDARKVFKTDDEVLVEELFVLPEAAELLRLMGFREEHSYFYFEQQDTEELADVFAVLSRHRQASTAVPAQPADSQSQTPPKAMPISSKAEASRQRALTEAERIKEQMRLDRLEKQKDLEYESIRSRNYGSSQLLKPQTISAASNQNNDKQKLVRSSSATQDQPLIRTESTPHVQQPSEPPQVIEEKPQVEPPSLVEDSLLNPTSQTPNDDRSM